MGGKSWPWVRSTKKENAHGSDWATILGDLSQSKKIINPSLVQCNNSFCRFLLIGCEVAGELII